jgi:hypothetical protein
MTTPSRRIAGIGTGLLLLVSLLAGVGAVPSYGDGAASRTAAKKAVQKTVFKKDQRIVVSWKGEKKRPAYQKSANVPGIGTVDLVCRPDSTQVRIRPNSRAPETQMWMAKFEDKGSRDVVAVKNVRVYTYATAADKGRGGTGARAHEGLNQKPRIEDFQSGNAYGVISQRPGRNRDGQGALTTPATSFKLTWWWERFDYPGHQYCNMALTLRTDSARQFGLSWHGDAEAARQTTTSTAIPGFGTAIVTCETGRRGEHSVAFRPSTAYDPATDPTGTREPFLDATFITGEGLVDDQVEEMNDLDYDPDTGLLGPVDLPSNGMMRLKVAPTGSAGPALSYALSSFAKTNDAEHPALNLCEVAAAPLP